MKVGRRIWLLFAIALGTIGCRAGSPGSLSLFPRPSLPQASLDVEEFIAQHNRNAESIQSLESRPSIQVAMLSLKSRFFHVDGRMALERPRNFRLELSAMDVPKADIGSNAEEFWFWVSNPDDPAIYWCNYADLESSALAVTYQPDWIIEAMGLKTITPEEAQQIQVRKGPDATTTALVFPVTRSRSGNYRRTLIVSNSDRRIKQLRIHSASEPSVLIAQADPSQYKSFPVKPEGSGTTGETCYLPEKLLLDWKRDRAMKLEVVLLEVRLNEFDPSRRSVMFTEPQIEGYQRRNLADLNRGARQQGTRTSTRSTLPPPVLPNGVTLGRPAPLSDDNPVVPNLGRATVGASNRTTSAPTIRPVEALVGSPLPRAPESPAIQAARVDQFPPSGFSIER